jgi:hypothetical protein
MHAQKKRVAGGQITPREEVTAHEEVTAREQGVHLRFHTRVLAAVTVLGFMANVYAKDPALLSLSMEHFRDTATVADDPADPLITISTEKGFAEHHGLLREVWNDEFLRGEIDKKTGQKSYQVYASITYSGNWRFYETANYQGAQGPRSAAATQIGKEAVNCPLGACTYTERLAFGVDESLLRQLAAGYVPGKPTIWHFRLIAKSGPDYSGGLSNAEIAGFLAKMDEYTRPLPAAKSDAVSGSLKLDFGIGGMPVDATAELPSRAGVLIIGVNRGSIAQKSGIIVGDILHEFNGHPIRSLADLEAAVAACPANATVAIKLYRGTEVVAVSAQF